MINPDVGVDRYMSVVAAADLLQVDVKTVGRWMARWEASNGATGLAFERKDPTNRRSWRQPLRAAVLTMLAARRTTLGDSK